MQRVRWFAGATLASALMLATAGPPAYAHSPAATPDHGIVISVPNLAVPSAIDVPAVCGQEVATQISLSALGVSPALFGATAAITTNTRGGQQTSDARALIAANPFLACPASAFLPTQHGGQQTSFRSLTTVDPAATAKDSGFLA